jgi:magnesium transporter
MDAVLYREASEPTRVTRDAWGSIRRDDENLLWIDIDDPAGDDVEEIAREFGFDRRAMATAKQANRRPIVRVYRDHFVVTVQSVDVEDDSTARVHVIEIDVIVGRNVIVSLHPGPLPFAKELGERTASNPHVGAFDAAYALYLLLDSMLDDYSQKFDLVEAQAERLENHLIDKPGRSVLADVARTKRYIQKLRRVLGPHREAFTTLTAPDSPINFLPDVDVQVFRDLVGRLDGLLLRLDHVRDVATSAYDLYLSNMSYQTNQQLKVLTFLSAVLMPMTLIVGLFGTNFKLAEYDAPEPFYVMLVGMAALAVSMLAYFRYRRWL